MLQDFLYSDVEITDHSGQLLLDQVLEIELAKANHGYNVIVGHFRGSDRNQYQVKIMRSSNDVSLHFC